MDATGRRFRIEEKPQIPLLSVIFGYGPMIPFVVGAIAAWTTTSSLRAECVLATLVYGCSILAFLAGVRRGLSFRTEGGPTRAQIPSTCWHYSHSWRSCTLYRSSRADFLRPASRH